MIPGIRKRPASTDSREMTRMVQQMNETEDMEWQPTHDLININPCLPEQRPHQSDRYKGGGKGEHNKSNKRVQQIVKKHRWEPQQRRRQQTTDNKNSRIRSTEISPEIQESITFINSIIVSITFNEESWKSMKRHQNNATKIKIKQMTTTTIKKWRINWFGSNSNSRTPEKVIQSFSNTVNSIQTQQHIFLMEGLIRRLIHRLIHHQVHLLIILLIHYISTGGRLLNVMMALKCLRRIAIMLLLRLVIYMKPLGSIFDFSLQSCANPSDPCGCFVWFF